MSFRIHSTSLELKRELERKLAELDGQIDEGFEYEISAEILPREQALQRAEALAQSIAAESVFVSEGVLAVEKPPEEDPDFAMGLPSVVDDKRSTAAGDTETTPANMVHAPQNRTVRIDTEKLKESLNATASQARAALQRAGEHTASAMVATRERTGKLLSVAGTWASQRAGDAKKIGADWQQRLMERSAQWKESFVAWNAQREERRRMESEARRERERAAHREAELAAASAQIMMEQRHKEEVARRSADAVQRKIGPKVIAPPVTKEPQPEYRDTWPVWRNAFVVAACATLIGILLLATGEKQSNAIPSTSTELSKPAVVVPTHAVENPKPQPVAPPAIAKVPGRVAKTVATQRVARVRNEDDEDFQEVTVRKYRIAPPKKDAKGVTQISDME